MVEGNTFLNTEQLAVAFEPTGSAAIESARDHYWNTTDADTVRSRVGDSIPYIPYLRGRILIRLRFG